MRKLSMCKKITAMTVTAMIAAMSLTACGSSKATETSTTAAASSPSGDTTSAEGTSSSEIEATGRLKEILDKGVLTVATEPYFAPNEFIDPSKSGDEQYVGSDIELAKYIADKLGVKCQIVPLEFSAVLSSVMEGKYDLAISALAYTPERENAVNLSKGYYYSTTSKGHGLVIREDEASTIKGPEDLKDKVVVVQSGSLQEALYNDQVGQSKELKRVSATTDGYLMIEEGKADAMIASLGNAELYIEANAKSGLMVVPDFVFPLDEKYDGTRVAIKKGEDALTEKVNEIIDELLASGQYEQWYNDYKEYANKLGLD